MASKADLINGAYSRLRISGITVQPTPDDISIALDRLEGMMAEWDVRNMSPGYAFEDQPNVNTESNIPLWAKNAVEASLAIHLCDDFGKPVPPALAAIASSGAANVAARTAVLQQTAYPSRMPRGSGASYRFNRFRRYFPPAAQIPVGPEVKSMLIGEIFDFQESWASFLAAGEDLASFTIQAQTGVNVVSSSLSTPVVSYRVEAVGSSDQVSANVFVVRITVVSTLGREDIRQIQFVVTPPEQI